MSGYLPELERNSDFTLGPGLMSLCKKVGTEFHSRFHAKKSTISTYICIGFERRHERERDKERERKRETERDGALLGLFPLTNWHAPWQGIGTALARH